MRKKLIITLVAVFVLAYGSLIAVLATGTKPALGLDLQGGISVTQKVKEGTKYSSASLDLAVEKIRERVDSLGVAEPEILRQGDTIVVNLPGVKNQKQAEDLVKVTGQVFLRPVQQCATNPYAATPSTETTVAGETTVPGDTTPATGDTTPTADTATATTASAGPSRPVNAGNTTTTSPSTTTGDTSTTTGDTAPVGTDGSGGTTTTVAQPTTDPFANVQSDPYSTQILPVVGTDQICQVGPAWNPDNVDPIEGTGEVFKGGSAGANIGNNGQWRVTVQLRGGSSGLGVWNQIASACFNKTSQCPSGQLAIELDGTIQSAPTMQTDNFDTGDVEISGSFKESEASKLAKVINSGALPVQLEVQSTQTVSPTLGKDSLRAAWISGLVGVGLVLLFMALYYRTLGLIVLVGMTVSAALLWSVIALLSKTQGLALSLSGIAGIIVSVGVTVDSYVVFFERLKDEVRSGRSLRNSAQRGFTAAWRTIIVADLVSLIGALVLWYLTVGAVRGFAFFLGLSTACDLVVSYFFTRPMVLLLARTKWMERRKVMGIEVATSGGAS